MEKMDLISLWVGVEVVLMPAEFLQNNRKHSEKQQRKHPCTTGVNPPQVLDSLSSPSVLFHSSRIKGTSEEQRNAHDARLCFTSYRFGLDWGFHLARSIQGTYKRVFSYTTNSIHQMCDDHSKMSESLE